MEVQLSQKQHVLLNHGQCIVTILHHCQTWCTALYDPGVGFVILRATPPRWHSNHHPLKGKVVPGRTHEHQKSLFQDIRASGQKEPAWLRNVVVSVGVLTVCMLVQQRFFSSTKTPENSHLPKEQLDFYREAPGFCPRLGKMCLRTKKTVAHCAYVQTFEGQV